MKTSSPLKLRIAARETVAAKARKTASKFADSFDPNGSYTGTALDGGKPIQDADDL